MMVSLGNILKGKKTCLDDTKSSCDIRFDNFLSNMLKIGVLGLRLFRSFLLFFQRSHILNAKLYNQSCTIRK
ncbi:hypothetical protein BpHYR1_015359 [Brachionus plicatilis]|uniref:Uncharacterized protein n=1 Tax=Brachionus plicatilis TaxID=10195 RepID=A0A3M7T5B3_BRAPC|nr:hypothetical protein BpHYR1_015359 [Brachionus plicatilis]